MTDRYRFTFPEDVDWDEVEATLLLAIFAAEAVHGEADVRLNAEHDADRRARTLIVDAGTEVGRSIGRLVTQFLRKEFGDGGFTVIRSTAAPSHSATLA